MREYKQSVDLSYRMDIELKLIFDFTDEELKLIGKMVAARSIRNRIMHDNSHVEENDIKDLIADIKLFLFMLINKYHSKVAIPTKPIFT